MPLPPSARGERGFGKGVPAPWALQRDLRRRAPALPQSHEFLSKERALGMGGEKKNVPSQQIPPQARAAQGPFVQHGCQPPAAAPSHTLALPRHPWLFRCPKDAITPFAPRGANGRGSAKPCLALACTYPILSPMAEMGAIPLQLGGHRATVPPPSPLPQQVGAVRGALGCTVPSRGKQSTRCWHSFLPILTLLMAGDRHAQPLTLQDWQASPAAGLRAGGDMGHAGTWGRTWRAPHPQAQHVCGA